MEYRIEHDTMGEVKVPKDALYGAQTQRAVENFPISGSALETEQIIALARIKKAAASANEQLGIMEKPISEALFVNTTASYSTLDALLSNTEQTTVL